MMVLVMIDDDCDNRFHPIKDRNDDDKNFS